MKTRDRSKYWEGKPSFVLEWNVMGDIKVKVKEKEYK